MPTPEKTQSGSAQRVDELAELVRQQAVAIAGLKAQLSKQIKREIANTTKQLEAHQSLRALIGDIPAPLHGWPISPDFALLLVRLIRDRHYDLIIEFGSGTSTLLSLRALESLGLHPGPQGASRQRLITFEHLEAYHQKTSELVASCVNRSALDLRLSPLEQWVDPTGSYNYYSGASVIADAIHSIVASSHGTVKLLVVIDGPPGATCHWARYPAVPIVLDAVRGADVSIDFLLDDMIRSDEQEMALAWEQQLEVCGLSYRRRDYSFEKGGMLLSVESTAGVDTSLARSQALAAEKKDREAASAAIARVDELLAELDASKNEQLTRISCLEAQLKTLTGERDAAIRDKDAALQSARELQQQLTAQAEILQQLKKAEDEQVARISCLEAQLKAFTAQRETTIAGLHRLRHLSNPTEQSS